jgi:hypothetical protein
MPGQGFRIFSREFKEAAVRRILALRSTSWSAWRT